MLILDTLDLFLFFVIVVVAVCFLFLFETLCGPNWPGTHYVDIGGLKFTELYQFLTP